VEDGELVRVLKALAGEGRFRMVQEIASAGELSCGEVGERFDLTQPTVSHHLKILAEAGVLLVRRDGQHAIISVNEALLRKVADLLPQRLAAGPRRTRRTKPDPRMDVQRSESNEASLPRRSRT
jgi:ArsR family transcriptional regulator